MKGFLKHILRKNSNTDPEAAGPISGKFTIGNPTTTRNNACETVFEGNYSIPNGTTATITGAILIGHAGGGLPGENGAVMLIGTINNVPAGAYPYSVNLGNSNIEGQASTYRLDIELSDDRTLSKLFQRTSFNHVNYDEAPC